MSEVEGLLREILGQQASMKTTLEAVHEQAKKTNGRVTQLEREADRAKGRLEERARVLKAETDKKAQALSWRQWKIGLAVAFGGSLVITVLTWAGAHVA